MDNLDEVVNETMNEEVEQVKPARKKPGPKPKPKVEEKIVSKEELKNECSDSDMKHQPVESEEAKQNNSESAQFDDSESTPFGDKECVDHRVIRLAKPVRCYSRPNDSSNSTTIVGPIHLTGFEFNGFVQVHRMKSGFGMVTGYIRKSHVYNQ